MENAMEETNLENIITVLENIEIENLQNDEQIQDWLVNITKPEFQLVDSMINLFLDNVSDSNTSTNILKVLRKFNIYQKENVLPQMRTNLLFPKAISEYIINTPKKNLSGDAFYILSDIFQSSSFKEVTNESFVKALFDGLEIITEEENFNAIVKIIIQINYEQSVLENKKGDSNLFVKIFKINDNSRILIETLLRIVNYEEKDKEMIYKILQCFLDMMDASEECILYSNDLDSFVNLSIKILESTYTDELRFYFLTVLVKLFGYDEYYKSRYRMDELIEILESHLDHDDIDEKIKELCEKIVEILNSH